jgi:hypothetical protein
MFEEYLFDAAAFLEEARQLKDRSEDQLARRYFRASVFCANAAIESYVNFLVETIALGGTYEPLEMAFLSDVRLRFNPEKLQTEEGVELHSVETKLRVLLRRLVDQFDFGSDNWRSYKEFKRLRDSLVHARDSDDSRPLSEYESSSIRGLQSAIAIMNHLNLGMFHKPLRKKLLELTT